MSDGSSKHDQGKSGRRQPGDAGRDPSPPRKGPSRGSTDHVRRDRGGPIRDSERATITSRERDEPYKKP